VQERWEALVEHHEQTRRRKAVATSPEEAVQR